MRAGVGRATEPLSECGSRCDLIPYFPVKNRSAFPSFGLLNELESATLPILTPASISAAPHTTVKQMIQNGVSTPLVHSLWNRGSTGDDCSLSVCIPNIECSRIRLMIQAIDAFPPLVWTDFDFRTVYEILTATGWVMCGGVPFFTSRG